MKLASLTGLAVLGFATLAAADSVPNNRLTVHEWGTFTVLQDEQGNAIGGVNTDDEPVPPFVHGIDRSLISTDRQVPSAFSKGVPRCDPSITVRLETPVLYFHPPSGFNSKVDVDVQFRGGWLTQYYPDAAFSAPGLEKGVFKYNILTDRTLGSLAWHHLTLGPAAQGPQTADPVWLAPRRVEAADIRAQNGESERFIFYRGVGHVRTPIRASRTEDGRHLRIQSEPGISGASELAAGPLWLVDVRRDGKVALKKAHGDAKGEAIMDATFSVSDYASDPSELRNSLAASLVAGGLFGDEAEALLNTWDASYFRRPGLRLFYIVPREWTDSVLPLQISADGKPLNAQIDRVMVGRIELLTPAQRGRLADISRGPASNPQWMFDALSHLDREIDSTQWFKQLNSGQVPNGMQGKIPADYRAYTALGRFRDAIVLDELSKRPTAALKSFIDAYSLSPRKIP